VCIGGVSFFSKRSEIGRVFPSMFRHSYWNPSFSCSAKTSPDRQFEKAAEVLSSFPDTTRIFLYINICAIHYPNRMYLEGAKKDGLESHAAALRYVDERLPALFSAFQKRGRTFVIACSDHGSCYPEEDGGYLFHGFNHEVVNTVPYMHFFL